MATVTSYGAAETVTGSCHLVAIGPTRILVDCGIFQGDGGSPRNYEEFGFDPKKIDYLVLTHAHLDHIGRVPKLIKEGFKGEIIATQPTHDIARIMLLDSARILQEEYKTLLKKARRRGKEQEVAEPLYTEDDVEALFERKWHTLEYFEKKKLRKELFVSLGNAGHIMGSAFVMLDFIEDAASKRIVFSGDLGSPHRLIIDSADTIDEADALFIESTYGDRDHKPIVQSVAEFKKAVIETLERDGNVLIPSFALERSQEVLWLLHEMFEEQELPKCRVFLDSPLAIKATELYNKYPIHLSDEVELQAFGGQNPFSFPWLEHTVDRGDSMKINNVEERAIIIAGSGMCNGGRIMHHLKNRLWNPNNAVVFVGFQVGGTLGRRIVDGDQYVKIYGEEILVRAKIYTINGFSAHGDQDDLIDWMKSIDGLEHIGLIHGETESMKRFAQAIKEKLGRDAEIVEYGIGIEV